VNEKEQGNEQEGKKNELHEKGVKIKKYKKSKKQRRWEVKVMKIKK
jgi:hypothetical protein